MASTGRVGRPPAGESEDTQRRILEAARLRFARDGFRATTNRLIADDVGITPNAIYHYVESKADLYAAVYCDTIDRIYSEFEHAVADHDELLAQFGAVLRRASDLAVEDPSMSGFIVAVAQETQRQPELLERMAPQRGRHTRFFADLVRAASARGELRDDVDQRAVADLLGAVLTGLARISTTTGDPGRYRSAVDVLVEFLDGSLLVDAES